MSRESTFPREGDTLVTLETDSGQKLEDRMELLTYAFAKIVQGAVLRMITKWDLKNGCIEFIVGEGASQPGPRGKIRAELQDVPPEVRSHFETLKEGI